MYLVKRIDLYNALFPTIVEIMSSEDMVKTLNPNGVELIYLRYLNVLLTKLSLDVLTLRYSNKPDIIGINSFLMYK